MPLLTNNSGSSENSETVVTTTTEAASDGETVLDNLIIGDTTTGYKFPNDIGAAGYILQVPVTGNELEWSAGGSSDIVNGGQPGSVTIGSNDAKLILKGQTGIKLEGGLDIQYDQISTGIEPFVLNDAHQFVEITNTSTLNIELPDADIRPGKQYIISKGTLTTEPAITIKAPLGETIDGENTFVLNVKNQRVSLISSGEDRWLIV